MAHHTRYLVSEQSNRNLALDREDLNWFGDLADADTKAAALAKRELTPFYVHVVHVTLIRQHVPSVTVKSSDTP